MGELGCDFYAASGQKWLCGPDGIGYLYVRKERLARPEPRWRGFQCLEDPHEALDLRLHEDARRLDQGFLDRHSRRLGARRPSTCSPRPAGPRSTRRRSRSRARWPRGSRERGLEVAPRGDSTLVSWRDPDPEARVKTMAEGGVVVRHLPGSGLVRASVGAWSSEEDLERLLALAA